jgi:hypothetical protein
MGVLGSPRAEMRRAAGPQGFRPKREKCEMKMLLKFDLHNMINDFG